MSTVPITVVTDKFSISSGRLTKAGCRLVAHLNTTLFPSISGKVLFFSLNAGFFKRTIRIMQLLFHPRRDKNQLVLLDVIVLVVFGRLQVLRSAWDFFSIFFRHCHLVWAADCEPCRPRSVNLWHIGFLAPLTLLCRGARGSAPRVRVAPPPDSPAPPSYAACTCNRDGGSILTRYHWHFYRFLLSCNFTQVTDADL